MPLFRITLSDSIPEEKQLLSEFSRTLASDLKKPEEFVQGILGYAPMIFAGTDDPSAFIEVKSIGNLSPQTCKLISQRCCDILQDRIGIPANRIYVEFSDIKPSLFGWNKSIFGE